MFDGVNLLALALALMLASMLIRTTSSQAMLRLALLWCILFILARGIFVVDRALPGGWTWKIVEILPALVFLGLSLLRHEPQRFGGYPWARRNTRGETP